MSNGTSLDVAKVPALPRLETKAKTNDAGSHYLVGVHGLLGCYIIWENCLLNNYYCKRNLRAERRWGRCGSRKAQDLRIRPPQLPAIPGEVFLEKSRFCDFRSVSVSAVWAGALRVRTIFHSPLTRTMVSSCDSWGRAWSVSTMRRSSDLLPSDPVVHNFNREGPRYRRNRSRN
jgi:hypothetical protein